MKSPYDILGVAKKAHEAVIKQAYRRLARRFHPDVSAEPDAEERFKEIQWAYETLSDPDKRRAWLLESMSNPSRTVDDQALAVLKNLADRLLDEDASEDPLQHIRDIAIEWMDSACTEIADYRARIEACTFLVECIGVIEGENVLRSELEQRVLELRRKVLGREQAMVVTERVLELLAKYEYVSRGKTRGGNSLERVRN